jgi:hypothetical protein
VSDWLQKGRLSGEQLARGIPWKISLTDSQIAELRRRAKDEVEIHGRNDTTVRKTPSIVIGFEI